MKKNMTKEEYDQCMLDYKRKVHELAVPIAKDIFVRNAPNEIYWNKRKTPAEFTASSALKDACTFVMVADSQSILFNLTKENEGLICFTDLGEPFVVEKKPDNVDEIGVNICQSCIMARYDKRLDKDTQMCDYHINFCENNNCYPKQVYSDEQ